MPTGTATFNKTVVLSPSPAPARSPLFPGTLLGWPEGLCHRKLLVSLCLLCLLLEVLKKKERGWRRGSGETQSRPLGKVENYFFFVWKTFSRGRTRPFPSREGLAAFFPASAGPWEAPPRPAAVPVSRPPAPRPARPALTHGAAGRAPGAPRRAAGAERGGAGSGGRSGAAQRHVAPALPPGRAAWGL